MITFETRTDMNSRTAGKISEFDFNENGNFLRVTYDHSDGRLSGLRNVGGEFSNVCEDECMDIAGAFIAQSL